MSYKDEIVGAAPPDVSDTDGGKADLESDEVDAGGVAMLDGAPVIRQTRVPLLRVERTIERHLLCSTYAAHETLTQQHVRHAGNAGKRQSFLEKLLDKYTSRRKSSKEKGVDYGVKEVFLAQRNPETPDDDDVSFGMKIRSLREHGIIRHYVLSVDEGSVADSLNLRSGDELLILQNDALLNENPMIVLDLFRKLDTSINLGTRRPIDVDEEHRVIYSYFNLKGTIKIFSDEIVQLRDLVTLSSVGDIDHILHFELKQRSLRQFTSTNSDIVVRLRAAHLTLDHMDNSTYGVEVLEYHGICEDLNSVIIWLLRCREHGKRYFIGCSENGDIVLVPDNSDGNDENLTQLGGPKIRWLTTVTRDSSGRHLFRSLLNTDNFLGVGESGKGWDVCCVQKPDWEAASRDRRTLFDVRPL